MPLSHQHLQQGSFTNSIHFTGIADICGIAHSDEISMTNLKTNKKQICTVCQYQTVLTVLTSELWFQMEYKDQVKLWLFQEMRP